MRALVVTAVDAERDAVRRGLGPGHEVLAGGVGPAAAAAAAGYAVATGGFDLILCAGIGGGFSPVAVGEVAVASSAVFADLGVETADGFVPLAQIGGHIQAYPVSPALAVGLADRTGGHVGTIVTVATVTGTAATAAHLVAAYPDAVAEGMEGAGVAAAAARAGVPFAEIRAVSNLVGPRDREKWRIAEALEVLARAVADARGAGWLS